MMATSPTIPPLQPAPPADESLAPGRGDDTPAASPLFILAALAVVFLVQLVLYRNSIRVLPASDDFPIVTEIHRGQELGIGAFFRRSAIQIGYRPLKSLAIWAAAEVSPEHWYIVLRGFNLAASLALGGVLALWLSAMRATRAGVVASLCFLLLHPAMPAAVASIDSIDSLMSAALLWLGGWCLWRWRDERGWIGFATCAACFVVGIGFKENIYALIPLAAVVVLMFWRRPFGAGAIIGGVVLVVLALIAWRLRKYVIVGGQTEGIGMLRFSPINIAKNATIYSVGLLFLGDSTWVYTRKMSGDRVPLIICAAWTLVTTLVIAGGVARRLRIRGRCESKNGVVRWLAFLLLGIAIGTFPTILIHSVSEMYLPPMLLPLSAIVGIAAMGIARSAPSLRMVSMFIALVALAWSAVTIERKVNGLVDVGLRAKQQLDQIVALLPPDVHDTRVALLFGADVSDRADRDTFSVYRMSDGNLLVHTNALQFALPGRHMEMGSFWIANEDDRQRLAAFHPDVTLRWDAAQKRFVRVPPRD